MKILKPVLLSALAFSVLTLNAQEEHTDKTIEDRAAKHVSHMVEEFELSDEQAEKLENAQLNYYTSVISLKEDDSITDEAKKAQYKVAKEDLNTSIKSILSEDQFAEFEEKSALRMKRKSENSTPEARAKKKAERLAAKLTGVTDEQKIQMETLFLKVMQKIEAVKTNEDLTEDQKVEFTKGNKTDGYNALLTILTEDQKAELEALKASRRALRQETKEEDAEIK